jgi:hypothetical protein
LFVISPFTTYLDTQPDILISASGRVMALRHEDTDELFFSTLRADKFSRNRWMEANGQVKASRWDDNKIDFMKCDDYGCVATLKGYKISFPYTPEAMQEDCMLRGVVRGPEQYRPFDLIISNFPISKKNCPEIEYRIGLFKRLREGAMAVYLEDNQYSNKPINILTVASERGERPWSKPFFGKK